MLHRHSLSCPPSPKVFAEKTLLHQIAYSRTLWGRGLGGGAIHKLNADLPSNRNRNRCNIAQNFFIRKPNHLPAPLFKIRLPLLIILALIVVVSTIQFNDHLLLGAREVRKERTDRMLASKLQTGQSFRANNRPDQRFRFRFGELAVHAIVRYGAYWRARRVISNLLFRSDCPS